MTSRVTGPGSPEPQKPSPADSKSQREAAQKIEKVREVDPDEQARQRKREQFEALMNDSPDDDTTQPRVPSPFETQFYSADDSQQSADFPDVKQTAIPSPKYSPPPSIKTPNTPAPEATGKTPLPHSDEFWSEIELPDQPLGKPKVKETHAPGKKTKEAQPSGKYWSSEEKTPETRVTKSKEQLPVEKKTDPWVPVESKQDQKDKKKKTPEFEQPAAPQLTAQLPPEIQTAAQQAVTQATPYLSPEIAPLFYQMVGSMMVMVHYQPGISKTEITLNSPAFARSKFFGAKIELTRYSTAPDSFNIRLTGSQEAVTAFRQSIPQLTAAFQKGNFDFRVGRLEAHYSSAEKPVFQRKEKGLRGDTGGGDLGEGRR